MHTLRWAVVWLGLSMGACGELERVDPGSAAGEESGDPALPGDGGGSQAAQSSDDGADAASVANGGVDAGLAESGCSAHADCARSEICGAQQQCVAGRLAENEPCDWSLTDERCCEHFHCCPVFHICVPNWWE